MDLPICGESGETFERVEHVGAEECSFRVEGRTPNRLRRGEANVHGLLCHIADGLE